MEIRSADATDLECVVQLRLAFLCEARGLETSAITERFRAATRAFVDRTHRDGRLWTWLAEERGDVLGMVSTVVHDVPPVPEDHRDQAGYIINAYVLPSARGGGVGRALLRAALGSADHLGIREFHLYATDAGAPLYVSEGFRQPDRFMVLPVTVGPR